MNEMMMFEGNEVEVFEFEGDILFNASHVARCLDISNVNKNISTMEDYEVIKLSNSKITNSDFRKLHNTGENFLTEAGVYSLIMCSRKPEAKEFKKWIITEVLPSIRQKGHYISDSEQARNNAIAEGISQITSPATINLVQMLLDGQTELINKNNLLETKIKEDEPLVTYANRVLKSNDCVLVRDVSKILSDEGVNMGEKKLYKKLREWGMIFKHSTEPMQSYVDKGIFVVEQYSVGTPYGFKLQNVTKVTPKGQIYIAEKLLKEFNK